MTTLSSWKTANDWTYSTYSLDTPIAEFGQFEGIVDTWNEKRRDGQLPAWRDFELEDLEDWWGWVTVMDLEFTHGEDGIGIDAHYRLWGTNLTDLLGTDLTNKSIRSQEASFGVLEGGYSQHDFRLFGELVNGPAIGRSSGMIFWEKHRSYVPLVNIRLPLADDGKTVDKFMSVIKRGDLQEP